MPPSRFVQALTQHRTTTRKQFAIELVRHIVAVVQDVSRCPFYVRPDQLTEDVLHDGI